MVGGGKHLHLYDTFLGYLGVFWKKLVNIFALCILWKVWQLQERTFFTKCPNYSSFSFLFWKKLENIFAVWKVYMQQEKTFFFHKKKLFWNGSLGVIRDKLVNIFENSLSNRRGLSYCQKTAQQLFIIQSEKPTTHIWRFESFRVFSFYFEGFG